MTEGTVKNKSLSKVSAIYRLTWKRMQEMIHSLPFQFIFFCFESMPDAVSVFDFQNWMQVFLNCRVLNNLLTVGCVFPQSKFTSFLWHVIQLLRPLAYHDKVLCMEKHGFWTKMLLQEQRASVLMLCLAVLEGGKGESSVIPVIPVMYWELQ